MITDCHIHIQPTEPLLKPGAEALMQAAGAVYEQMRQFSRSPAAFLKYLDEIGVDRAVLIGSVSPEVIGLDSSINSFYSNYARTDPKRLIPCGGLHPKHTANFMADLDELLRLGIRLIKIHPPHQLFYPNDYLSGMNELELMYRAAEANGLPVMFHTGTSVFPGARNKYGDPIYVDDVAVDFPQLKILLAHGGRPLWMDTAFFLLRRHPNVYLDISGIPPRQLLNWFPRLEEIAHKTLFGSDWPGPGAGDIRKNLDAIRALPLSDAGKEQILGRTAARIWPE
ncbi:MAG: amidohydrolase family protein [Terriglobales bacterium]